MYEEFKNKVIVVTGSSSGIGEDTVITFASFGGKVVITGRNEERVRNVALKCEKISPFNYKPLAVIADLKEEKEVKSLVEQVITVHGTIDVLINNAGVAKTSSIFNDNVLEDFDEVMKTNLRSVVQLCHLFLPSLIESKGTIINVSSLGGIKPFPMFANYCCAKAGLDMLTRVLALELGPQGVRVNSVNPSSIETPIFDSLGLTKDQLAVVLKEQMKQIPLRRLGKTEEIVNTIVFLSSSKASFINGVIMPLDGGLILS